MAQLAERMSRCGWLLCGVLCAHVSALNAADVRKVLREYQVSGWSQMDGLPRGAVNALAQDAEGYLWAGTESGAFRFDGVQFTPATEFSDLPALQKSIRALLATRDGTMWFGVGATSGGVVRFDGKHWSVFGEPDGLNPSAITFIVQDSQGTIWTGTTQGLFSLSGGRWIRHGHARGLPEGTAHSAYAATNGDLLVGMANAVYRRRAGSTQFERMEEFAYRMPFFYESPRAIAENASGEILVSDAVFGFHPIGKVPADSDPWPRGRGRVLLQDRRGNLWVGTNGQGLWRVPAIQPSGAFITERLTALTGLLSDGVRSLLEDRDGNLWVGTSEGLNRLTRSKVIQITDIGLVIGVETAPDGGVWVGTVDELLKFAEPGSGIPTLRMPMRGARLRALHSDGAGGLWIATATFLGHIVGGRLHRIPIEDGPHEIETVTPDGAGGLWLHDLREGLMHWTARRLNRWPLPLEQQRQRVAATFVDSSRRTWLAFSDGPLAAIHPDGSLHIYGPDDGVDGGPYRAIHEHRGSVWFAGAEGLTRLSDGQFRTVKRGTTFPLELTTIVDDGWGGLYLGASTGIARIDEDDFEKALDGEALPYTLYDRSDGLAGLPLVYSTNRRAIRARDNRLWFLTARGLTVIDPRELGAVRAPSPVQIENVISAEARYRPVPDIALPPGTSRLEISYAVLDLTSPFKTRFRYRLQGVDAQWTDAGQRRQAFYTNLSPGRYRFEVVASGRDGASEASRATWVFSIRPMFYQTIWFYGAIAVTSALGLTAAWRLRLRQVRHEFSLLLGERTRLSRAIHDTLLQGLVGLALKLDAIANDLDDIPLRIRSQFAGLRDEVEDYIRDARQSILHLRSPSLDHGDFASALRAAGEHITEGKAICFSLSVSGRPPRYSARIEEQLLRIGQEAIINAVRHARADEIQVHISYERESIILGVSDNGCGFDASRVWREEEGVNHYGLIGMKERAEEIGGAITITSDPNHGTHIRTVVPLTHAPRIHEDADSYPLRR